MHSADIRYLEHETIVQLLVAVVKYSGMEMIGFDNKYIEDINSEYSVTVDGSYPETISLILVENDEANKKEAIDRELEDNLRESENEDSNLDDRIDLID